MRRNTQRTDEMWRDFLTAGTVFGRGENYRAIGWEKSTLLARRSEYGHGVKFNADQVAMSAELALNRVPAFLCSISTEQGQ